MRTRIAAYPLFLTAIFVAHTALLVSVWAADSGQEWPDGVEQGDLLELQAPEADSYDWAVLPNETTFLIYDRVEGVDDQQTVHQGSVIVVSTKFEGDLYISLAVSKEGVAETILHKITIGEIVEPPPQPDPPPVLGEIFAVFVEETGDRDNYTPEQIQALISKADHDYMDSKGYGYFKVDKDVVEPDGQGGDRVPLAIASFLKRAKSHQSAATVDPDTGLTIENKHLPRLIIANSTGAVLHDDLVTDESSLLETLKQYGGE